MLFADGLDYIGVFTRAQEEVDVGVVVTFDAAILNFAPDMEDEEEEEQREEEARLD